MSGIGGISTFAQQGAESVRPLMDNTVNIIRPVWDNTLKAFRLGRRFGQGEETDGGGNE